MELQPFITFRVAVATTLLCLASSGCSSSEGYVDYSSIPGPEPEATESIVETDDASGEASADTTANETAPQPVTESQDSSGGNGSEHAASNSGVDSTQKQTSTPSKDDAAEPSETSSTDAAGNKTPSPDTETEPKHSPADIDEDQVQPKKAASADSADNSKEPPGSEVDPSESPDTAKPAGPPSAPLKPGADATSDQPNAVADGAVPATTPAEPREIKLLIPQKSFRPEGDSDSLRLTYDDIDLLKILNMEPVPVDAVEYFPEWLKSLNGKRIRLRGFMYPTFIATGIQDFSFARDNGICCFVRQPKIYDMIDVILAESETTDYIEGKPFDVEGVFRIEPEAGDGELYRLYRIEDAKVLK